MPREGYQRPRPASGEQQGANVSPNGQPPVSSPSPTNNGPRTRLPEDPAAPFMVGGQMVIPIAGGVLGAEGMESIARGEGIKLDVYRPELFEQMLKNAAERQRQSGSTSNPDTPE